MQVCRQLPDAACWPAMALQWSWGEAQEYMRGRTGGRLGQRGAGGMLSRNELELCSSYTEEATLWGPESAVRWLPSGWGKKKTVLSGNTEMYTKLWVNGMLCRTRKQLVYDLFILYIAFDAISWSASESNRNHKTRRQNTAVHLAREPSQMHAFNPNPPPQFEYQIEGSASRYCETPMTNLQSCITGYFRSTLFSSSR